MKIIVARYNENIQWTTNFSNVIIYNKGNKLNEFYNEILLDNVGRECHTYYKYIYDNYYNLDDYTVFLQGNPFDHSPNLINNLNSIINNSSYSNDFYFLSKKILNTNLNDCPHHKGLPLMKVYNYLFNDEKYKLLPNFTFKFGGGGQFIVSKIIILKRPREFYLKIVKLLEYDVSPIEGYVIERFHYLIFS